MRAPKCRIWDKKHETFVTNPSYAVGLDGMIRIDAHQTVEPDRYVIQQFTGYTDRHGNEVYEGDRIKIGNDESVYTVIWGYFKDCCVEGETWILEPERWQPTLWYYANDMEDNEVEVIDLRIG